MPALTTSSDGFLLHGEPFRIISGALHYFRVHPDQWTDRLRKARLMGLNTVETYLPWNLHEPEPGTLVLDGLLDLPRFLRLARAEGLHVLLRPGPYICAEWDDGGLPAWLISDPGHPAAHQRSAVHRRPRALPGPAPATAAAVSRRERRAGDRRTGGERIRRVRDDTAYLKHVERRCAPAGSTSCCSPATRPTPGT